MSGRDRLAALLHGLGCRTKHHRPLPWCEVAADRLIAAGVGFPDEGCDCVPEHVWPCALIPRCDEPGCKRETTCGFPTPTGYRRTCGKHFREYAALGEEPTRG